jgi:hypothetical protein
MGGHRANLTSFRGQRLEAASRKTQRVREDACQGEEGSDRACQVGDFKVRMNLRTRENKCIIQA